MEISPEKCKLDLTKTEFVQLRERQAKPDIIGNIIGLLTMSKEERFRAGIYVGREGREWIDRSALIFPFLDQDNTSREQDESST